MKNKKSKKALKVYGVIGKSLCAVAGGIVGYVLGGPVLSIPGVIVGVLSGHLVEKSFLRFSY